jgi:hypothetical protein
MKRESVRKKYEDACNGYLQLFCRKHGYRFEPDSWAAGYAGGIADASGFYVGMETLRADIDSDAPQDEFLKWYSYCMRAGALDIPFPSFDNWLTGCPRKTEEELLFLEKKKEELDVLKKEFLKLVSGS